MLEVTEPISMKFCILSIYRFCEANLISFCLPRLYPIVCEIITLQEFSEKIVVFGKFVVNNTKSADSGGRTV